MAIPETGSAFCPRFHSAVELIGRRWTGAILRAMRSGHTRFTDIAASVPGLHDRLLADRLRELEAAGVVRRDVSFCPPARVDYRLTEMGQDLDQVMDAIAAWAERWVDSPPLTCAEHQAQLEETLVTAASPSSHPARDQ